MDHLNTASHTVRTGTHGWTAGNRDFERAFRAATRHSRMVRFLRRAIPVALGLALVGFVVVTWFNPLRMLVALPANLGNLVVAGSKITMENPRLAGFTRDNRSYEVTARAAAQDLTRPQVVELTELKAKIELQNQTMIEMLAATGTYDTKAEMLTLSREILLSSSSGYAGRMTEAIVDVRKSHVVSTKPVEIKLLNGFLNANRLDVIEAGDLVRFGGGVTMVLTPGKDTPPADPAAVPR